ncbi:MAG: hypothetical protein OXC12_15350 [Spirochaetaceae bacterium]|nr:hypothetical protein [Spirochaetaceae bacterium]
MSEYQYYEFQAIDRPLSEADRQALRELSTRARITATSFTNEYHWGDFKGSPVRLMERWFDLHLYLANWGTRRLMIRLPQRLVARSHLDRFLRGVDLVRVRESGENLIVDVHSDDDATDYADYSYEEDDTDCLAAIAPLRAAVLAGDWRLFYLLWLTAVQDERLDDGDAEPLAGIGPLTGALKAFADFFGIDPHLVQAAAESSPQANGELSADEVRAVVAAFPDTDKTALLCRLVAGDPHVAAELGRKVREADAAAGEADAAHRTVADLRTRAAEIHKQAEAAKAARREAERRQRARAAEQERRARLVVLRRRGAAVWREVETEIEKRNAGGYDRALELLLDLKALAQEDGSLVTFSDRARSLRDRHSRKLRFIERLQRVDQQ